MDTLRSASHLQRELGDNLFNALVSSDNTEAVRQFASGLVKDGLPTTMTIAGRTYEILGFLRGDEKKVPRSTIIEHVKEMQANLGQDDGQHLLDHQEEIPEVLRGKVVFVFTDWRFPNDPGGMACVYWKDDRWVQLWDWTLNNWRAALQVLHRI
ncbi:MAG: hypothetical protein V1668_03680 [Patescibacteria group bacterium]